MYDDLENNFKELIKNGRLSHSYLFFGVGEEKSVFSRSLANFLEKGKFEEPKEFLSELLIISPNEKGSIGIDKIKNIMYYLWQKPVASLRRVVIIENAQTLTAEAQNAALKIVEEPPERGFIIFLANSVEDLLPTLNSRLQKIYFSEIRVNTGKKAHKYGHVSEDETDDFFRKLIANLMKDPIKNSARLKEVLRRLVLVKQLNLNKRLQLKSLE